LGESYPDLKANTNFIQLQEKLNEIEENLERSRRYYNGTVRENNTYGESFPGVLFASILNYKHFDFFEAEAENRENVKVDFS
jgi:LemA protein